MLRARALCVGIALVVAASALGAALPRAAWAQRGRFSGQPTPPPFPYSPPDGNAGARNLEDDADLRGRFGVERAARLMRSDDEATRLHGVERAAAESSPEAMALLLRALEGGGAAQKDARVLIAVARGLAQYAAQAEARSALQNIVSSAGPRGRAPLRAEGGADSEIDAGRVDLARGTAALALAESSDPHARDMLWSMARGAGSGQPFAADAIAAFPLAQTGVFNVTGAPSPTLIRLIASLGDLRGLDVVRSAAKTGDSTTRAAALTALGEMGDLRGLDVARAAAADIDPSVRVAAARALLLLGAPEAPKAVAALVADDTTALAGARLAELIDDDGVVKALAARLVAAADLETRRAAIEALGRSTRPAAVEVLLHVAGDPVLAGDAAAAIARSPCDAAESAIEALLRYPEGTPARRLAVRATLVRAVVRGKTAGRALDAALAMSHSRDATDRAVALAARVALRETSLKDGLANPDPRVKRAVAAASLGREGDGNVPRELLRRLAAEADPVTRVALSAGLSAGDPDGVLTTTALLDRAESGEADAPLAAMAFAMRAGQAHEAEVARLLASRDPLIRAHVARGLGASGTQNAIGRLANAYAYEADAAVRAALVLAVGGRTQDVASPERKATLMLASQLDPDRAVRAAATRALHGLPAAPAAAAITDIAWLRLSTPDGRPPHEPMTAALLRSDGLAVPIVFDGDGYALVPVPPGATRLVLAPHVSAYEASAP